MKALIAMWSAFVVIAGVACAGCGGSDRGRPLPIDGSVVRDAPVSDGAAADAGARDAGPVEAVTCGSMTCGPDEYCEDVCLCCGFPTGDGGPTPASRQTCRPIPAECDPADFCACRTSWTCDGDPTPGGCVAPRTVSCRCA